MDRRHRHQGAHVLAAPDMVEQGPAVSSVFGTISRPTESMSIIIGWNRCQFRVCQHDLRRKEKSEGCLLGIAAPIILQLVGVAEWKILRNSKSLMAEILLPPTLLINLVRCG